jgi:hypothetical protein
MKNKKLYEFSAYLKCAIVIAAEFEDEARAELETWESSWNDVGEILESVGVDLLDVRDPHGQTRRELEDEAHVILGACPGDEAAG